MDVIEYSDKIQKAALNILEQAQLVELWEGIGAEVHIVGSAKTGLLIHKDIDVHVYTVEISIQESFLVMAELAKRINLLDIQYRNLLDTEEECIEWHALFKDKNNDLWKLDLIHIRKGSLYDGIVEKVTHTIKEKLTPEIRQTILQIKYQMPTDDIIPGIEVYHAVFEGKVKSYNELIEWRKTNLLIDSLSWRPL